jgi:hypothetical protein
MGQFVFHGCDHNQMSPKLCQILENICTFCKYVYALSYENHGNHEKQCSFFVQYFATMWKIIFFKEYFVIDFFKFWKKSPKKIEVLS